MADDDKQAQADGKLATSAKAADQSDLSRVRKDLESTLNLPKNQHQKQL